MPRIAVTSLFLKAFMRIPRAQQRKALDFIERFQADPTASGINYETIQGAKDKKLRSARLDLAYRAVILHPDKGDVYRLVWVDKHDEAYAWAKNRVFTESRDGSQCLLIVENLTEIERRVETQPCLATEQGVLAAFNDDDLRSVDVPDELIPLLRKIHSADVLTTLQGILADHVLYALQCLAAGKPLVDAQAFVADEEAKLKAETRVLLGSPQHQADTGRIEPVGLQHGLREILERLMASCPSTATSPAEDAQEIRQAEGAAPTTVTAGLPGDEPAGPGAPGGHEHGLEDRVKTHLQHLQDYVRTPRKPDFQDAIPFVPLAGILCKRVLQPDPPLPRTGFLGRRRQIETASLPGEALDLLMAQFDAKRGTLLYSQGGSGKSTTLETLASCRAQNYQAGGSVCVLIRLVRLRDHEMGDLSFPAYLARCPEVKLTEEDLRGLAEARRLELILDGADESPTAAMRLFEDGLADFASWNAKEWQYKVPWVISARTDERTDRLEADGLQISPMDESRMARFAAAYLPDSSHAAALLESLRAHAGAKAILGNPICLYMVCILGAEQHNFGDLLNNIPQLYRLFFQVLYYREGPGSDKDPALGKGHKDLFRDDLFPHFLSALAKVAFHTCHAGEATRRSEVVAALQTVIGARAADAVKVLERWPIFQQGKDGPVFSFFHETYREYLAAEFVLGNPIEAAKDLPELQRPSFFFLSCLLTLKRERYTTCPLRAFDRALLEACWSWDPIAVAALMPGDDRNLNSLSPVSSSVCGADNPDAWWLGVIDTLQGRSLRDSAHRQIVEVELSHPPANLIESLQRTEMWQHAYSHAAGTQRFDRLFQLISDRPEPWADLLQACVSGCSHWTDRIRTGALLDRPYVSAPARRYRQMAFILGSFLPARADTLFREQDSEDYDGRPSRAFYPPESAIPAEWKKPDGGWLAYALLNAEWVALGYILWFLHTRRWFDPNSVHFLSRRQWNQLWRWGGAFVDDLPSQSRPDASGLAQWGIASSNIAAAIVQLGWLSPDAFPGDVRRKWATTGTFDETLALLRANLIDRTWIPYEELLPCWVRQATRRCQVQKNSYEADRVLREWPGWSLPWDAIPKNDRDAFLRCCTFQRGIFDESSLDPHSHGGKVPWHMLPTELRRRMAVFSLAWLKWDLERKAKTRESDSKQAADEPLVSGTKPTQGHVDQPYPPSRVGDEPSPHTVISAICAVAGRDELPWNTLLSEERTLLCHEEAGPILQQCLVKGIILPDTLRAALDSWHPCAVIEAIVRGKYSFDESIRQEVCRRFDLDVLQVNRPLGGGLSGSAVFRVYCRHRGQGDGRRLAVLKQAPDYLECFRELDGHTRATTSWMAGEVNWVPEAPQMESSADLECYYLLSRVAFRSMADGTDSPTLHERIQDIENRFDSAVTERLVEGIGRGYAQQLNRSFQRKCSEEAKTRREHLDALLHHWNKLRPVWEQGIAGKAIGLPSSDVEGFQDRSTVYPNPYWALQHAKDVDEEKLLLPMDFQHGDLNARNILVAPDLDLNTGPYPSCQFIDFEKATTQLVALDPCWLAFWVLIASQRKARVDGLPWAVVPEAFIAAVFGQAKRGNLGELQLGLDLVRAIFGPFHSDPAGGSFENRALTVHQLVTLTLTGAALAKSAYEIRDMCKRLDQGEDPISDVMLRKRAWAVTFYRISAMALARLFPTLSRVRAGADIADALQPITGG